MVKFLKKNIESNLLFLCFAEFTGSDCLGVIEKEVILNDINIKNKKKAEKSYKPTYDISAYEQTGMLGEEWDD